MLDSARNFPGALPVDAVLDPDKVLTPGFVCELVDSVRRRPLGEPGLPGVPEIRLILISVDGFGLTNGDDAPSV